ncbi:MAG: DUF4292 domain-containing protein [Bacteroidaceae bacterium]|nr:DUF4292 domain-containing protein [Bacteroidaceae bacterium]
MKRIFWLLIPALLMLSACRSSKKGVGNETDPTQPTTTVHAEKSTDSPSKKKDKQDPDLGKMKIPVGTNFTSKVRVTITQNGKDITTNGNLRMRYDDVIQITLFDPLLGIAEVGRMELSPDNVLIIDKVNRRYTSTTYDEFSALKSRNIDFKTIQDFFWKEAQNGDKFAYTIPAKSDIKLDLKLSNKGNASNWSAHTQVSDKYTKTDANKLFSNMINE